MAKPSFWPLLLLALVSIACKAKTPVISEPFSEDFERAEVGPGWHNTGGEYAVKDGKLNVTRAHNHPLWLRRKLPRDVVVELDVMSKGMDPSTNRFKGDSKIELFGDGESYDPDTPFNAYFPSGYVFVFGGWNNSNSIIGRKGEHDDLAKVQRPGPTMEPGRTYKWKITRKGSQIDWLVDGQPFLSWNDPEPLAGEGQEYLGINAFDSDVWFDNLRIAPAP